MSKWKYAGKAAVLSAALLLAACGGDDSESTPNTDNAENVETGGAQNAEAGDAQLTGTVVGDGSSTVAPITEALVEEYAAVQGKVQVSVGVSGTGGGFEKFINGETDFSNASRPIKDTEVEKLAEAGIEYTELAVAYDGLSVVIHPENTWAKDLTVDQLKQLWIEDGTTKKWSDIDPSWPAEEVVFYAPGTDSGTYDYFDEVILDGEDLVKSATLSEDDNVLVQGVIADKNAIAFFGYSYYIANEGKLHAVSVNGVEPNSDTIESGEYSPLSRPLFVYVKNEAMATNEAAYDFLRFTLENAGDMAEETGYVRLPAEEYTKGLAALEALKK
ncbi:PstS family phosphate ABC transporter substrate-binding protein [Metasolibacillus sp. FSL H7-0170]|uniref:PstS family phosphate ABC transporter substrate-binding protein n=1 Tax=Metasolibacillus TaxID=2703677 RepID=UPI00079335F1|nr:PstS family phosphate ABC transporter substrate-binding protein [Metasolibacillus fluoroglycofenilyticus]KYG92231.1 phosphate-binding protein [[Bacillus] sp. KCTC 13219]